MIVIVVLFLALTFSMVTIGSLIVQVISALITDCNRNITISYILGIIAITLWCWFYYLTH